MAVPNFSALRHIMVVKSGGIVDSDALCEEWWGLREYIAQTRHLPQEQLVKLLLTDATVAELYPSMGDVGVSADGDPNACVGYYETIPRKFLNSLPENKETAMKQNEGKMPTQTKETNQQACKFRRNISELPDGIIHMEETSWWTEGTTYNLDLVNYQNKCRLIRGWDNLFNKVREAWKSYNLDLVNYQDKCRLISDWDNLFNKTYNLDLVNYQNKCRLIRGWDNLFNKTYNLDLVNYQNKCRLIRGWDNLFNKVREAWKSYKLDLVNYQDNKVWELSRVLSVPDAPSRISCRKKQDYTAVLTHLDARLPTHNVAECEVDFEEGMWRALPIKDLLQREGQLHTTSGRHGRICRDVSSKRGGRLKKARRQPGQTVLKLSILPTVSDLGSIDQVDRLMSSYKQLKFDSLNRKYEASDKIMERSLAAVNAKFSRLKYQLHWHVGATRPFVSLVIVIVDLHLSLRHFYEELRWFKAPETKETSMTVGTLSS
ncbi:Cytoplasmic dynein 1 heavy chain 1 [Branchiostoma belcheri]|nr:Cytoplasmic dynein 1 heavy chain 1 [Branchiostoma belcheri]